MPYASSAAQLFVSARPAAPRGRRDAPQQCSSQLCAGPAIFLTKPPPPPLPPPLLLLPPPPPLLLLPPPLPLLLCMLTFPAAAADPTPAQSLSTHPS